jgi:hypothetical protein
MNNARQQKIIEILKRNDSNSVPFIRTKDQLLYAGYSEKEIIYALYSFPYDGKPNIPSEENPLKDWYEKHPEHADQIARTLLKDQARNERDKAFAYAAASEFAPGPHAQSYYDVRLFDELSLPYYTLFFIGIVLGILMVKFDLPEYILYIYALAVNIKVIYELIQRHRKARK